MKNVKSAVLGMSIALASMFGAVSTANAAVPSSSDQQEYQSQDSKSSNIPESYHKYGFGEVKADGQWVNDN